MKIYLELGHSHGRGVGYYAEFLKDALLRAGVTLVDKQHADIIHYPFFDLFYPTLPIIRTKKTIVTVHDVTPLVLSNFYPRGLKGDLSLLYQKLSLNLVDMVITDSLNSKEDIHAFLQVKKEKIRVIPLAVDPVFSQTPGKEKLDLVRKKYNLPSKFVLTVAGGPNRNKNLPLLAAATQELKLPLVIVGGGMLTQINPPVHPELIDLLALREYSHLILPGFVPTSDLVCLYHLAEIYCQPSLYEGFGLPVLEAMAAGCLIVSSNTSSLPEIHGASAVTFDPKDKNDLVRMISKVVKQKPTARQRKINLGLKLSQQYSWEKTADLTVAAYKDVLSG